MDVDRKIKDIYNISFDLADISKEDRCPMHEWYDNLINKTMDQLDLFDVTRMIIQKIILGLAVSKAISFVKENPFCGQRYEGELLELLCKLDKCYLKEHKAEIEEVLKKALNENKVYDWLCEEERKEFSDLVRDFLEKLQAINN